MTEFVMSFQRSFGDLSLVPKTGQNTKSHQVREIDTNSRKV